MSNYSDVKNYIHNDLDISKQFVEDVIIQTVQQEIHKLMQDENRLYYLVETMVKREIKEDRQKILYHVLMNFDSLLDHKITETVFNEVKSRLKIELVGGEENGSEESICNKSNS